MTPFKKLRLSRGLTQQELADKALVSLTLVRTMDGGYIPPKPLTRKVVADALGVTAAELFG